MSYRMSQWFENYGDRVFDFLGLVDEATEELSQTLAHLLQQLFVGAFALLIIVVFMLPVGIVDFVRSALTRR